MACIGLLIVALPCLLGGCGGEDPFPQSTGPLDCCPSYAGSPAYTPGDCSSYAYACLCHRVADVAAVGEGTVRGAHQEVDDPCSYPYIEFDAVYGKDAMKPPNAPVCGTATDGDGVIVPIRSGFDASYFSNAFLIRFKADGNVVLSCGSKAPALKKEDAIAALLAQTAPSAGSKECSDYLIALDPGWGLPECN